MRTRKRAFPDHNDAPSPLTVSQRLDSQEETSSENDTVRYDSTYPELVYARNGQPIPLGVELERSNGSLFLNNQTVISKSEFASSHFAYVASNRAVPEKQIPLIYEFKNRFYLGNHLLTLIRNNKSYNQKAKQRLKAKASVFKTGLTQFAPSPLPLTPPAPPNYEEGLFGREFFFM